jgi:inward rectifier potassium channel
LNRDLYHRLIKISWPKLFLSYVVLFFVINFLFSIFYYIVPGSISGGDNDFKAAFFFSVQTFSTVGYGIITPASLYGNIIVVLEIMAGVISMALTTGLIFAKFSRPSAKLLFTKNLLLTTFDQKKVLMFRLANARTNFIISANIELHYIYPTVTSEGISIVRFAPLKLEKSYSPVFSLSWSVFHPIDEDSPFFNKTLEEIKNLKFEFYVIFQGIDGTVSQTIHDVHTYKVSDILFDHHFVDILERKSDGTRIINYAKFHEIQVKL